MPRRGAQFLSLLLCLSLGGACAKEKKKRTVDDDDEDARATSSERRAARSAGSGEASGDGWPIVELTAGELRLDGKVIANTKAIADSNRLQKIDELFNELKQRREAFKAKNPDKPFPGVCGLRVEGDVPLVVFKSAFQTAAYAGYPHLSVQVAGSLDIVDLGAQIPGPPDPRAEVDPKPPEKTMHVQLDPGTIIVKWRQGSVVVAETRVAREPKELARVACADWKIMGSHKDPSDPVPDEAVFQADHATPFKDAQLYLQAIQECKRPYPESKSEKPVFDITFSIR